MVLSHFLSIRPKIKRFSKFADRNPVGNPAPGYGFGFPIKLSLWFLVGRFGSECAPIAGERETRIGHSKKNDLSLKLSGHFSQDSVVGTVSAVADCNRFFGFVLRGLRLFVV